MPDAWQQISTQASRPNWYRLIGGLNIRVRHIGSPHLLAAFDRYFSPLSIDPSEIESSRCKIDFDIILKANFILNIADRGFSFSQSYRGGHWQLWADHLKSGPCKIIATVSRLGQVMFVQAGLVSLMRLKLAYLGHAWIHAACIVKAERILVIAGPSGIGKSQIVLRAIRDGWKMITDDHVLISEHGVTGITTPLLLRGYGGTPDGMTLPASVRRRRCINHILQRATLGRINLMTPYSSGDSFLNSPAPINCSQAELCILRPDKAYISKVIRKEKAAAILFAGARDAGRFLDQLIDNSKEGAKLIDMDSFWNNQKKIIDTWVEQCQVSSASIPRPLDEHVYQKFIIDHPDS